MKLKNHEKKRNYTPVDKDASALLTDDYEESVLQPINSRENDSDEILYGGDESDFDREYWDNSDEHEYYDEPEKAGYHPDNE